FDRGRFCLSPTVDRLSARGHISRRADRYHVYAGRRTDFHWCISRFKEICAARNIKCPFSRTLHLIKNVPTQIQQIDLPDRRRTILRVEGDMLYDDAILLEKIAACIKRENGNHIIIDLADLDLLDSEAASILKRLEDFHGCEIEGVEIFLQTAVNMAER